MEEVVEDQVEEEEKGEEEEKHLYIGRGVRNWEEEEQASLSLAGMELPELLSINTLQNPDGEIQRGSRAQAAGPGMHFRAEEHSE